MLASAPAAAHLQKAECLCPRPCMRMPVNAEYGGSNMPRPAQIIICALCSTSLSQWHPICICSQLCKAKPGSLVETECSPLHTVNSAMLKVELLMAMLSDASLLHAHTVSHSHSCLLLLTDHLYRSDSSLCSLVGLQLACTTCRVLYRQERPLSRLMACPELSLRSHIGA